MEDFVTVYQYSLYRLCCKALVHFCAFYPKFRLLKECLENLYYSLFPSAPISLNFIVNMESPFALVTPFWLYQSSKISLRHFSNVKDPVDKSGRLKSPILEYWMTVGSQRIVHWIPPMSVKLITLIFTVTSSFCTRFYCSGKFGRALSYCFGVLLK